MSNIALAISAVGRAVAIAPVCVVVYYNATDGDGRFARAFCDTGEVPAGGFRVGPWSNSSLVFNSICNPQSSGNYRRLGERRMNRSAISALMFTFAAATLRHCNACQANVGDA